MVDHEHLLCIDWMRWPTGAGNCLSFRCSTRSPSESKGCMAGMNKAQDLLHLYSDILVLWMLHRLGQRTAPLLTSALLTARMVTNLTNNNLSVPQESEVVRLETGAVLPHHQIPSPSWWRKSHKNIAISARSRIISPNLALLRTLQLTTGATRPLCPSPHAQKLRRHIRAKMQCLEIALSRYIGTVRSPARERLASRH